MEYQNQRKLKQYMTDFCEEEVPIYDNPCLGLHFDDNILVILFNHNFQVKTAPVIEVQSNNQRHTYQHILFARNSLILFYIGNV